MVFLKILFSECRIIKPTVSITSFIASISRKRGKTKYRNFKWRSWIYRRWSYLPLTCHLRWTHAHGTLQHARTLMAWRSNRADMRLKTIDFGNCVRSHCSYLANKVELWSWVQIPYGPEFFPGLISIITSSVVFKAARISYSFLHRSAHIWFSYIYNHYSSLGWFIWTQHNDQLPVGMLAQLVERCTGIAMVMGSNPVRAWIFFRSYFSY